MPYAKAIAALVVSLLTPFGITGDMSIETALVALITTAAVYFIPNKPTQG